MLEMKLNNSATCYNKDKEEAVYITYHRFLPLVYSFQFSSLHKNVASSVHLHDEQGNYASEL